MNRGYSLIELIVTIVIILILGAGAVSAYLFVFRKGVEAPTIIKDEMELQLSLAQLLKDVESIGFGLTTNYLKAGNSCTFSDLLTNNQAVSICTSPIQLLFMSLSSRSQKESGCWGYTDKTGCAIIRTGTKSALGYDCPTSGLTATDYTAIDFYKTSTSTCTADTTCPSGLRCGPDKLVFYTGGNSYPSDFAARYYLSSANLPDDCATGTSVLVKELNGDIAQPLISCVHTFRVYYLIKSASGGGISFSYSTSPPTNIKDLKGIRLCMLVQVGKRRESVLTPQNLSANCGGSVTITSDQRYYRWKAIELDIPVRNLK